MYSNNEKLKDAGVETKQQQRNETHIIHTVVFEALCCLLLCFEPTTKDRTEENRFRASSSSTRSITGLKNNNNKTSLNTDR